MNKILNNKHFKFGGPMIVLIVGGSWGLKYYSELRYEIQNERHLMTKTKELRAMLGQTEPKTLEEQYADYQKSANLDDWKNVRGPRPWENDNTEYKDLIERRAEESKNQWRFEK